MSILQTTTSANCQGEINLYVEPMFSGFVLMHKNSCRQEGMWMGAWTGMGFGVSSSAEKKKSLEKYSLLEEWDIG